MLIFQKGISLNRDPVDSPITCRWWPARRRLQQRQVPEFCVVDKLPNWPSSSRREEWNEKKPDSWPTLERVAMNALSTAPSSSVGRQNSVDGLNKHVAWRVPNWMWQSCPAVHHLTNLPTERKVDDSLKGFQISKLKIRLPLFSNVTGYWIFK